jgi:hypothetical protein
MAQIGQRETSEPLNVPATWELPEAPHENVPVPAQVPEPKPEQVPTPA